jgi:hypothetical protein
VNFPSVLRKGFALAHERPHEILLDLLWKAIWFTATVVLIGGAVFWLIGSIGSLEWQGPELALPKPIILAMAIGQLWSAYSRIAIVASIGAFALTVTLRIALEAYFRGGGRYFWIFAGSRLARNAVLSSLALILGMLVWWDRTAGFAMVAVFVMALAWFVATLLETLVRKDAIPLLGIDLPVTAGAIGLLLSAELLSGLFLAVFSVAMMLLSSRLWEFIASVGLAGMSAVLWSVLQSYLLAVRFSTVDIMRRDAGI